MKQFFFLVAVAATLVTTGARAEWRAASSNGYSYWTDDKHIALPFPNNQWYVLWRYQDGSTMSYTLGADNIAKYVLISGGRIYDYTTSGWIMRTTCNAGEAKQYKNKAYMDTITNANNYYLAVYYAKYAEAEAYLAACLQY